jgi:hypothetical protein
MRRYCAHELGMKVIAVDDMSGGFASNIPTRVEFVKGDLQVFVLSRGSLTGGPYSRLSCPA